LRELGVGQSRHLGAEDERDVAVGRRGRRLAHRVAHGEHAPGECARPSGEAYGERASRERGVERRDHLRRREHVRRAGRERRGLGMRKMQRLHEHEARQPHREHRACRRADVARMRSVHEHHAQARERVIGACDTVHRERRGKRPMNAGMSGRRSG